MSKTVATDPLKEVTRATAAGWLHVQCQATHGSRLNIAEIGPSCRQSAELLY